VTRDGFGATRVSFAAGADFGATGVSFVRPESALVRPEWAFVTLCFKDKTECITICMLGSSSIHIVTSSVNNQQQYYEKRIKRL
jgi:hypothetical protein